MLCQLPQREARLFVLAMVVAVCGLVAFFLLLAVLLTAGPVNATTMIVPKDEALTEQADVVVEGKVLDIRTRRRGRQIETVSGLEITDVLKGSELRSGQRIALTTPGGSLDGVVQHYGGVENYQRSQHVIVFLRQDMDGTFHSLHQAAGTWTVTGDGLEVQRKIEGAVTIRPGALSRGRVERRSAAAFRADIREHVRQQPPGHPLLFPPSSPSEDIPQAEPFQLFNNVRWFEPDSGGFVKYLVSTTGDADIGAPASILSVEQAFLAWSRVQTTALSLSGNTEGEILTGGCDGRNTIRFDDPEGEIDPPADCAGVLALGGYCASSESKVVNGVVFRRIVEGDVVFADGWGPCGFWNAENLAEVATHELGHTIGLAHSEVQDATMSAYAHFDHRGASLRQDDVDAVTFVYPMAITPVPVTTATPVPTQTIVRTSTPLPTPTVPLAVAVVTERDLYLPGAYARIIVRTNTPYVYVRVDVLRHDVVVWSKRVRIPSSLVRYLRYRVPRDAQFNESFTIRVTAEREPEAVEDWFKFQIGQWAGDCLTVGR